MNIKRRVTVEIDLDALVRNYRRIVAHVRPMKVLCVLKANAYGLGVGAYAKALFDAGCREFGVAEPYEALELMKVLGVGSLAKEGKIDKSLAWVLQNHAADVLDIGFLDLSEIDDIASRISAVPV